MSEADHCPKCKHGWTLHNNAYGEHMCIYDSWSAVCGCPETRPEGGVTA